MPAPLTVADLVAQRDALVAQLAALPLTTSFSDQGRSTSFATGAEIQARIDVLNRLIATYPFAKTHRVRP